MTPTDEAWMQQALALADKAEREHDEVPVGALVIGPDGVLLAEGFNRNISEHDPSAHAELIAMRAAAAYLSSWRLVGVSLYVTLEPCPMCAGAIVNARVARLVYGADDPKAGAVRTLYSICDDARLNHRVEIAGGVLAEPCGEILQSFFRRARARRKGVA